MVATEKGTTTKTSSKAVGGEQQAKGPTGVLSSKLPLPKESDKKTAIEESKNSFHNRRRIQITGIPPGTSNEVSTFKSNVVCRIH